MNDDLLIQRYLDGQLAPDEVAALEARLRDDPALRDELRTIAEQAMAFADFARRESGAPFSPVQRTENTPGHGRQPKPIRFTWLALAASIAVLAASAWFFMASQPATVLTLLESTGTVAMSDGSPILIGAHLPAGTIETVGEASTAQFRFLDGSIISLQGQTVLTFSDDGQKVLSLSRGTISAQVKPQPEGRPMIVRTPSAVAEVVGTTFDLTARTEDTLLKVNEGLVKLKRLADGSQIDVSAKRSAVASLDDGAKLNAADTPEPLTHWSFDFTTTTPPRDWRGYAKDGVMVASPYVAKKHDDGRVTTHFGISIRTAMLSQPLRLMATEKSVLRFRVRQDRPGGLQVMLVTNRPQGGFGGNFECEIPASELVPSPDGWCDLEIPMERFRVVAPASAIRENRQEPVGKVLTSVIVNSFREDRQLVMQRFELHSPP
jgi:ferric-dicitrate binding protein FerR (iron transport regulator)